MVNIVILKYKVITIPSILGAEERRQLQAIYTYICLIPNSSTLHHVITNLIFLVFMQSPSIPWTPFHYYFYLSVIFPSDQGECPSPFLYLVAPHCIPYLLSLLSILLSSRSFSLFPILFSPYFSAPFTVSVSYNCQRLRFRTIYYTITDRAD